MENRSWLMVGGVVAALSIAALVFETFSASGSQDEPEMDNHPKHHAHGHDSQRHKDKSVAMDFANQKAILPIPQELNIDKKKAKIGWLLFRDPNLSSNNLISCESCHNLQTNGAENREVSLGVRGRGFRNSLTVFNTAFNYRFFWDGRVNNLHDQLDGPIHNIVEMDSNWKKVKEYVSRSQSYNMLFSEAGLDISVVNIKSALVEFMEALTTPDSPFDQYLMGNKSALNMQQQRGWEAFQNEGCVNCHRGINIGGGMVMKFGFFGETTRGNERSSDTGRHINTSKEQDMYLFRVASLRNVALTAPYFHDGKTDSLEEAINIMAESQLGKTFEQSMVDDINAFLTSLSGSRPAILEEFENEQN